MFHGVDLIVFTGGIGENDAVGRAAIREGLSLMGINLDHARNHSAADTINSVASRCFVRIVASQEDKRIARHTSSICEPSAPS